MESNYDLITSVSVCGARTLGVTPAKISNIIFLLKSEPKYVTISGIEVLVS